MFIHMHIPSKRRSFIGNAAGVTRTLLHEQYTCTHTCAPALVGHWKGWRASRDTIQGEMEVPKFLDPKGPRGTYSHF